VLFLPCCWQPTGRSQQQVNWVLFLPCCWQPTGGRSQQQVNMVLFLPCCWQVNVVAFFTPFKYDV
jgi:hypothetical protein